MGRDDVQTSGIGELQRRKQNVGEDAKDDCVDFDAQSQHQDGGGTEP